MEVVIPIHHTMDFDFNSARSSPVHLSNPSTPKGFREFYSSAPNSPTRLSQFCREFDEFLISSKTGDSSAAVPFAWEEKPGTPKSSSRFAWKKEDDDFAFDIRDDIVTASLSAEELFDGGVIKPLKPSPRLLSPSLQKTTQRSPRPERGRERAPPGLKSSSRRTARSLSPLRVSQYPWEEEQSQQQLQEKNTMRTPMIPKPAANSGSSSALALISKGYKKLRLKDFFLFRSASEGRASDKDPLKKYTAAFRRFEDVKSSSRRSFGSPNGSVPSRRRAPVSAHELHYTVNKAVSEDLKKKTFLPYKQGILGRLAFNPAVHALANGFGLSHK